jgi:hypothetical protein
MARVLRAKSSGRAQILVFETGFENYGKFFRSIDFTNA